MFEMFKRREPKKKPQVSSHYPLFNALCRIGIAPAYGGRETDYVPPMILGNVSLLSNGNIIIYDENAEKVLEFFTVQEILEATRDFEDAEKEADVKVLTGNKKILFSFSSLKDKNIFWTVLNYARGNRS